MSYFKDIWKLWVNTGSKNSKFEYKLNYKNVNEECDVGVHLDEAFKADNHMLSIVSRKRRTIDKMDRNFISIMKNVVLKIYITQISLYIEYSTLAPVSRHGNQSAILRLEGIQRVTKIIKRVKDYSNRERLEQFIGKRARFSGAVECAGYIPAVA